MLLQWLGKDPDRIPPDAQTDFVWMHAPYSWLIVIAVLIVIGWAVYWMYRREMDSASRSIKLTLAGIRGLVILLLILVFLGPAIGFTTQRTIEPYVLVLLDESLSMSIEDGYREESAALAVAQATGWELEQVQQEKPTRAEIVNRILQRDDNQLMRDLAEHGKVRVMSFADAVKLRDTRGADRPDAAEAAAEGEDGPPADVVDAELDMPIGDPVPPLTPTGQVSDYAKAVRESLRAMSGNRVAAIVMIGDFQSTAGGDPLGAARTAEEQRVPIFAVGVGESIEARNLRVVDVIVPESVFKEDPFQLKVDLAGEGIEPQSVDIELIEQRVAERSPDGSMRRIADAPERVVARRAVNLSPGETERISFERKPEEPGEYIYTVRMPVLENELFDQDNQRAAPVKVLSNQARVLLVAGAPSWEYQLVSTLLTRDKTVDLSCWLQTMDLDMKQAGDTSIPVLPTTKDELFKYDVILLFDPDPAELTSEWVDLLKQFLDEHSGGVLYMSGPIYTSSFLSQTRTAAIQDVLPINVGDAAISDPAALLMAQTKEWPLVVTAVGADHPMLEVTEKTELNQQIWEAMPGVYWSFPIDGAGEVAQTLIEHGNPALRTQTGPRPLLVTGQYGGGRTVYLGFNGTWRWRKLGEEIFDRFWVQTVRWLVEGRLVGSQRRGRVSTDRDIYSAGEQVRIKARLTDVDYSPLRDDQVIALIRPARGEPVEIVLRPIPNRPGEYEGSVLAAPIGTSTLAIELQGRTTEQPVTIEKRFAVEIPRVEFADPRLDRQTMTDLAELSGGRVVPIDDIETIPALIPDRRETLAVAERPAELWDSWPLLLLVLGLLSTEWAIRKRSKLL